MNWNLGNMDVTWHWNWLALTCYDLVGLVPKGPKPFCIGPPYFFLVGGCWWPVPSSISLYKWFRMYNIYITCGLPVYSYSDLEYSILLAGTVYAFYISRIPIPRLPSKKAHREDLNQIYYFILLRKYSITLYSNQ